MRKLWFIIFILIIIPVFAYDVYTPDNYKYEQAGDKLLFVVDGNQHRDSQMVNVQRMRIKDWNSLFFFFLKTNI